MGFSSFSSVGKVKDFCSKHVTFQCYLNITFNVVLTYWGQAIQIIPGIFKMMFAYVAPPTKTSALEISCDHKMYSQPFDYNQSTA